MKKTPRYMDSSTLLIQLRRRLELAEREDLKMRRTKPLNYWSGFLSMTLTVTDLVASIFKFPISIPVELQLLSWAITGGLFLYWFVHVRRWHRIMSDRPISQVLP